MSRVLTIYGILLLSHFIVNAQQQQYSLYNFAMTRVNPGSISLSDYASVGFVYRSQQSLGDVKLNSFLFSAKYPLIAKNGGRRWSSIGITAGEDKSGLGGLFEATEAGLTYALNFPTGENASISIGTQINYQVRKINSQGLTTGSQFVSGQGFVPGLDPGDNLGVFNTRFLSINSGVSWQKINNSGKRILHVGSSVINLNRPDESFLERASALPVVLLFEGGGLLFDNRVLSIYSEFLYTTAASTSTLNAGVITTYAFDQNQFLDLHTKYLLHQGIMMGLQWRKGNIAVGTSYDIPVNKRVAHTGAFEIGLELRQLVKSQYKQKKYSSKKNKFKKRKPVKKKRKKSKKPSVVKKTTPKVVTKPIKETVPTHQADSLVVDTVISPEPIDVVKEVRPSLDQTTQRYEFGFNISDLHPEERQYLMGIIDQLKDDKMLKIEITGHTDNVGKAEYNLILSNKRAKAFNDFFVQEGIDGERITYTGKGESDPMNDNSSSENRSKNRRVEIFFHY